MELIHTLLFMLRDSEFQQDIEMADQCLKSLEKSMYKTVVVFNQGFWDNETLKNYLESYQLNCIIIGAGTNVGIVAGRQACFEYVWGSTDASYVSELHLDMIFTDNWEAVLIDYLKKQDNEPMVSCGIVTKTGEMVYLDTTTMPPPNSLDDMDGYLANIKKDVIVNGFTHPCVHKVDILKEIGGFDTRFLNGKQAFEDDSLLLGYHYYYGTRANWIPKVNYNSVVCHHTAGQRLGLNDDLMINYNGLVKQYGAMGVKILSRIHRNPWSITFFTNQFEEMLTSN